MNLSCMYLHAAVQLKLMTITKCANGHHYICPIMGDNFIIQTICYAKNSIGC